MALQRIFCSYFSPTGGVKKVAQNIYEAMLQEQKICLAQDQVNLNVSCTSILSPKQRQFKTPSFTQDDLLIFCFPVFYGRMPWVFYDYDNLLGNGAQAVVVSVYGGRAIEDGQRETVDLLTNKGFKVIASIETLARHSQKAELAQNRPDLKDQQEVVGMIQEIMTQYRNNNYDGTTLPCFKQSDLTAHPYKDRGHAVGIPCVQDEHLCDSCHHCVNTCPMAIIDKTSHTVLPENVDKCMGCWACIAACKKQARHFPHEVQATIAQRMELVYQANQERKPNILHLPK